MLAADRQARHGLAAPWLVGKSAKEYRATMGSKPVIGLFGIGLEERIAGRISVTSNAEIRIWALDAIANGMRPWFTKFSAHAARSNAGWARSKTSTCGRKRTSSYLTDRRPLARVAMVYSQQTAWYYGAQEWRTMRLAGTRRWSSRAFPLRWCTTSCWMRSIWQPYKTLILPNLAALSDAQCDQLRAFVQQRRKHRRDARDQPVRRDGNAAQELRARRPLRRRLDGQDAEARC